MSFQSTHVLVLTRSSALMFYSFLVGMIFLDVSTNRPNICGFDGRDYWYTLVLYIEQYYFSSTAVLAVKILRVYSVLDTSYDIARTLLMHVARTTSSVRSRYPSTWLIVSLICSVSSWFSFGITIRSSKQYTAGLVSLLCNRTHSE